MLPSKIRRTVLSNADSFRMDVECFSGCYFKQPSFVTFGAIAYDSTEYLRANRQIRKVSKANHQNSSQESPYNTRMKDITVDADKFEAVLQRMVNMKPMTAKELSAKLKAEREAKKAARTVQKMDK